jgi:hypothetical protein
MNLNLKPYFILIKVNMNCNQEAMSHLRWMLQKDILGQDIFLIGKPGPLRRRLALAYLELTNKSVEFVSLSQDTTEADLKQRREIIGGTAKYINQVNFIKIKKNTFMIYTCALNCSNRVLLKLQLKGAY